jgi:lysyl-tRNA synthetase class 2
MKSTVTHRTSQAGCGRHCPADTLTTAAAMNSTRHGAHGAPVVTLITWITRALALIFIASVVFAPMRRWVGLQVRDAWGLSAQVGLAGAVVTLLASALLLVLANGLRRGKRRAWQITVTLSGAVAIAGVLRLHRGHELISAVIAAGLCLGLLLARRSFTAQPDRLHPGRAAWIVGQLLISGFVLVWALLALNPHKLLGHPGPGDQAAHAASSLIGMEGPVHIRSAWLDMLTATVGLSFGVTAALAACYLLLRTFEPTPRLSEADQHRIRHILGPWGEQDSLAYFALRPDKSVLFSPSGKAAISYRVLAGVALASGDPLGDPEAWPGAIREFLNLADSYAWTPAVLGCSERGAQAWIRQGLDALELGDEAILELSEFTLQGRRMRGVRQAASRIHRAGYTITISRVATLSEDRRAMIIATAQRWRGRETERGYSMALSRLADPADPNAVIVVAELNHHIRGILQLVPWGTHGLSLDQMRRDPQADNGINDFMIARLAAACPALGVERISLNFAVLRAALERGKRIGAGPVARGWFHILHVASRWWQIESLYRFNARFHPRWSPRFIAFHHFHTLPRVALAALEAEGFGGRPSLALRVLYRSDTAARGRSRRALFRLEQHPRPDKPTALLTKNSALLTPPPSALPSAQPRARRQSQTH